MFMKGEFSNRLLQVSLFAGIVYYITAYPVVFESARKYFPIKFKKTHHLLIFHTFVFGLLMYFLTYFVFDPIVKVVEGAADSKADNSPITILNNLDSILNIAKKTHLQEQGKTKDTLIGNICNSIKSGCIQPSDCGFPGVNMLHETCTPEGLKNIPEDDQDTKTKVYEICKTCYDNGLSLTTNSE